MTRPAIRSRMPAWQRYGIYAGTALLALTGGIWLLLETFVRIEGEFGPERLPLQHWLLVAHGIGAYAFLPLLGLIAGTHAVQGWILRRNRTSGSLVAGTMVLLMASALALYYAGAETLRNWSSLVHWIAGFAVIFIITAHIVLGRRTRSLR